MLARSIPVALAALALLAMAPAASAHDHVEVHGYEFTIGFLTEPALVDEPNGVSLRVAGAIESGNISVGSRFAYTFPVAGTFRYHCHLHPSQQGNVTITAATAGHGAATTHHVQILDGPSRFSPEALTIRAGDTVVWHNNGTAPHTVSQGAPAVHGHGGHGGGHAHAETSPITGLDKTLKVTVSTGGKSVELSLEPAFRDPGHYVARFIPTVAGVYTFHFKGTIAGHTVDLNHPYDADPVVRRGDLEFPEQGISNVDTLKRLDDTKKALGNASAGSGNNAPSAGPLLGLAAAAGAAAFLARRR